MNSELIQQIPLDQIRPSEGNRKYGGFDPAKLQELADSIKAAGVLQPVLVRQNGDGAYELVAGERRWRAARMAGLEVLPCVVRELDDMQVLKIQLIENLQREDIHPLDEADGYARLIERAGYDVEHLAQEVDRSPSYVYQRLKLRDLVPPARKMLVEGAIQAGHAILLARLQPAQQKEVLASYLFHRDEEVSVRQVDSFIREQILLDLARAAFKKDDPDLDPKAGPCTSCPKRTGYQPALFADVCNGKRDYCTDPPCFHGKAAALVQRRRLELKESGEKYLEVMDRGAYALDYREQQRLKKAGVKESYSWEECKKSEEGAVPVIVVAGDSPGRLTYGKDTEGSRYRGYRSAAADKKARQKQLLEAKIKAATRRRIWDAVLGVLDAQKAFNKPRIELLRMIATGYWKRTMNITQAAYGKAIGWEVLPRKSGDWSDPWERTGRQQLTQMDSEGLIRFMLTLTLAPDLEGPGWQETECRRLKDVADLYDIDVRTIEEEVKKEFQEKAKAKEERAKKAAKAKPKKKPPAKKAEASKK